MRYVTRLLALCAALFFAGFAFATDTQSTGPAFVADGYEVQAHDVASTQPGATFAVSVADGDGPAGFGFDASFDYQYTTNATASDRYAGHFAYARSTVVSAAGDDAKTLRIRPGWRT